ncbi:hypothetical protein [Massilia sp. YMA4]|uniref:DUF6896 domain-containing protein n=1 Tax=Massilia sp. YMA4 TaxID=1593482 RepID=UPI000DD15A7E|nr:hypothetical protein [Massilia sp. YMA4]AXA90414.1 hypothetical protein DPH57_04055 [Massilia sp. YMA4]
MNHINLATFLSLLRKFTGTQVALISIYLALASKQDDWPRKGTLSLLGAQWDFVRHGAGVRFTNLQTQEEIDAHTSIEDAPQGFDEWRLEIYFSSIEHMIVDVGQDEYDLQSDSSIKPIIEYLLRLNKIAPIPGTKMYELT